MVSVEQIYEFIWAYNKGTYPLHYPLYLLREDNNEVYLRSILNEEYKMLIEITDYIDIQEEEIKYMENN